MGGASGYMTEDDEVYEVIGDYSLASHSEDAHTSTSSFNVEEDPSAEARPPSAAAAENTPYLTIEAEGEGLSFPSFPSHPLAGSVQPATSAVTQTTSPASSVATVSPQVQKRDATAVGAGASTPGTVDWMAQFKRILDRPSDTLQQRMQKAVDIRKLLTRFEASAIQKATTIIEEIPLPNTEKTIKAIDVGGQAGGQKFISDGIFFKLATDWKGLYGGDAAAMKAAGHELIGLKAYFQCGVKGLYVPLTVVIDYCGYRVLAESCLNIDTKGNGTLVYGSRDAGRNVKDEHPEMREYMKLAARNLNLKGHYAGNNKFNRRFLYGPLDLEGHQGYDNKLYVLDTARVFPPEAPTRGILIIPEDDEQPLREERIDEPAYRSTATKEKAIAELIGALPEDINVRKTAIGTFYYNSKGNRNKRANVLVSTKRKDGKEVPEMKGNVLVEKYNSMVYLYRLLRPELVASNEVPLSSDAFSRFGLVDEAEPEHRKEVAKATHRLLNRVIPDLAKQLNNHTVTPVDHKELIEEMHKVGINVRFLGRLRHRNFNHHLRSFLLTEMSTRIMKQKLRKIMRKSIFTCHNEEQLKQRIVDYFNLVLGTSKESDNYWKTKLKIFVQFQFGSALSTEEAQVDYDLRSKLLMFPVFQRLQETTGIRFSIAAQKRLFEHPYVFESERPLQALLQDSLIKEREKDSTTLMNYFDERDEVKESYHTLIQLYHHQQIESSIGTDSPEALQSFYALAHYYKEMGNTSKALDYALRGLYYGENLFGSFSEVTLEGMQTVGEIFENAGKVEEAVDFYQNALKSVEKLHRLHPITGKLNLKLYFLMRKIDSSAATAYLQKSYADFAAIYGPERARIVVPLLALKNSIPSFTNQIHDSLAGNLTVPISKLYHQFWPEKELTAISNAVSSENNEIRAVLSSLELESYVLQLQYHEIDYDTFLTLKDKDLKEIGITNPEHRALILQAIAERQGHSRAKSVPDMTIKPVSTKPFALKGSRDASFVRTNSRNKLSTLHSSLASIVLDDMPTSDDDTKKVSAFQVRDSY
ncbi:Clu domain-containing protein [Balamuthia mandrillaris]